MKPNKHVLLGAGAALVLGGALAACGPAPEDGEFPMEGFEQGQIEQPELQQPDMNEPDQGGSVGSYSDQ